MSIEGQEAYDKAMGELEEIEKAQSGNPGEDELDELTKSLEEELAEEPLEKGHKEPDGDEDGKGKAGDDDEDDDEGAEPDGDEYEKAMQGSDDDELIKASECYGSLEKSVHEGIGSVHEELFLIRKSLAAQMNLNIKLAKVIAVMAKSMPETEGIIKSMKEMGAQPVSPSKAVLGFADKEQKDESLVKSHSEVSDLLLKAVSAGKIDSRWVGVFSTYKEIDRLSEEVRTIIGL